MNSKIDKALSESKITFEKIDKIISSTFLYYAAICGFIFGWFSLAVIIFLISGEIPLVFVLFLRIFYFLLSFLFGLKLTIFLIHLFRRKA